MQMLTINATISANYYLPPEFPEYFIQTCWVGTPCSSCSSIKQIQYNLSYKKIFLLKVKKAKLNSFFPQKKVCPSFLVKVWTQNATKGSAEQFPVPAILSKTFLLYNLKNRTKFSVLPNAVAISEVKLLLVSTSYLYICRATVEYRFSLFHRMKISDF